MTTWTITPADRDEQGSIKVQSDEPRSLADLLPRPSEVTQDAKRQPWTRLDAATLAVVGLCAAFVLIYAWSTPRAPTVPPQARVTTVATLQPTAAPTVPPATPVATPLATSVPTDEPAPVFAPAVEQPAAEVAPCSADIAQYRVERQVLVGTLPIGAAMGFSCASAAEAEANASAHEAEVRASYAATTTTKTSEAR